MEESVYLPLELILEILLRLPVKTLLRFRCVCKSWFSLFSNNSFATSHFQLAAATRRLAFINRCGSKLLSIDVDAWLRDDFGYALLTDDFVHPIDDVRIIGSCRGFLVLHSDAYFYIWNPSTRLIKQIPQYPITFSAPNFLYGFPDNVLFGFGYDQSTDDYFIVSWFFKGYRIATSTEFLIFSLRANNWKPIEVPSHFPYMITAEWGNNPRGGLFLNDSIHWVVYNDETSKNVIVALDLKEMTISEIALPDDSSREYVLLVVGGLINAWMKNQNTVKIWVMQQYAVHSSWTKTIEFSVDPVLHNSLSILCITSCGVIIGKDGEGRLVKFNDKGDLLEHPFFYNHSDISEFVVYTESLFLLPDTNTSQV